MTLKNLVVTTDFSEAARKAYPAVRGLASTFGSQIYLVHVAEPLSPHLYLHQMGIHTDIPREPYLEKLDQQLERERVESDAFREVAVESKLLYYGTAPEALNEFIREQDIDLVVISTHGRSGIGYALLGSFTLKVVRHSSIPVFTFREKGDASVSNVAANVLVPFDFSENARAVFPLVRFLSKSCGSKFTFVYVVEPLPSFLATPPTEDLGESLVKAAEQAPKRANELFMELRKTDLSDVDARLEIVKGAPDKEIISCSKKLDSDLILMATHGWTGFMHFFLGSVTEKVVHKAPCSVLTIRPDEKMQ